MPTDLLFGSEIQKIGLSTNVKLNNSGSIKDAIINPKKEKKITVRSLTLQLILANIKEETAPNIGKIQQSHGTMSFKIKYPHSYHSLIVMHVLLFVKTLELVQAISQTILSGSPLR